MAEMNLIGIPVPPGFTITTEVCGEYYSLGREKVIELLKAEVQAAVKNIETLMNSTFGDPLTHCWYQYVQVHAHQCRV